METAISMATAWEFPVDVLDFAHRRGLEQYLGPLTAALDRIFPTPQSKRVSLGVDRDRPCESVLVFDVVVTEAGLPTAADDLAARRRWRAALMGVTPRDAWGYFPFRLHYAGE